MSAPNDQLTAAPDTAVLQSVQRFNQPRIIGKLLHDLRNPVHSLRIAVELFGRIARGGADAQKLLEKSERYAVPAEGAAAALATQIDRLSRYLSPPLAPAIAPLALNAWLTEIATLLRESTDTMESSVESHLSDDVGVLADAPRLSHAVLHWALTRPQTCVLHASVEGAAVRLRIHGAPAVAVREGAASDLDLQRLIGHAGGVCDLSESALTIVMKGA